MKTKPTPPATPELEKLKLVSKESQAIGQFLETLRYEDIILATFRGDHDELVPVGKSIEATLADYFDIDLNKVEQERRSLLDYIREVQK